MLNVKMKTHFLFFFTEWKNDLLAAFSMHPTTSTTRTCRGVKGVVRGRRERGEGREGVGRRRGVREEGGERESVGKKDKGKLLDKHKHGGSLHVKGKRGECGVRRKRKRGCVNNSTSSRSTLPSLAVFPHCKSQIDYSE